jgi:hypothetical protein
MNIAIGTLGAFLILAPQSAHSADSETASLGCPGYAEHLRTARAYLASSDRANAVAELKRARESLRACEEAQAGDTMLAACTSSTPSG